MRYRSNLRKGRIMKKHIISEDIFSPQSFLELITGKTYIIGVNPLKLVNKVVKEVNDTSGNTVIKRYCLSELEEILADDDLKVVLVNINNNYYWYSIPDYPKFEYTDSSIIEVFKNKSGDKLIHFFGYHSNYTDDELNAVIYKICNDRFDGQQATLLPQTDKIVLAKKLHFEYNADNGKIARLLKLNNDFVDSLFPLKKKQ